MSRHQERLHFLLQIYAANQCTEEQLDELFSLIRAGGNDGVLLDGLREIWENTHAPSIKHTADWERIYQSILNRDELPKTGKTTLPWQKMTIAASILLAVGLGFHFYRPKTTSIAHQPSTVKPARELVPGGDKAILTLANGEQIVLDGKNDKVIAENAGITISKTADGQLVYQLIGIDKKNSTALLYNTIEVPKGGQYQITMADGTKVWLNSMSSLKYPVHFKTDERVVELTGEGYFEVAKDAKAPFKVMTNGQVTEVLGTHFNVNAYGNEKAIRTTLLEGAVKVKNLLDHQAVLLAPGQQALNAKVNLKVYEVDLEQAVAWKNGNFMFNNNSLEAIMRSLERWYDIEVIFKNEEVKRTLLSGSVSRFENASQVFDVLELTGLVRFKIEGRRVMVM